MEDRIVQTDNRGNKSISRFLWRIVCGGLALSGVAAISVSSEPTEDLQQLLAKAEKVRDEQRGALFGDKSKKPATLTDGEVRRLAEYYRSQYPFESLRGRAFSFGVVRQRPGPQLR
jgi:hypothetical protein